MVTIDELEQPDWREFREIRMRALADAPDAFCMRLADAEQQSAENWRARLSPPDPILVVRDEGAPVAMAGGWVPPEQHDRMAVWGMWTAPEARGHGHGRSLIAWLLDWAGHRGITTVELHVTEGNDTARRLYEQCGFEATGEWEPLREGSDLRIELMRRGVHSRQSTAQQPRTAAHTCSTPHV